MKRTTLLLLCLLVFALLVGGGAAWMYFTPGGALAPASPDDAVQAVLDTTDTAEWRAKYVSLCTPETSAFESAETVAGDLFDAAVAGQTLAFRRDSDHGTRSAPVYILSAGDADLLTLTASYDKAAKKWGVEPAPLHALTPERRDLVITVPEDASVSVNGIALGEEYITDSSVSYTGISELETQFDTCPHRVTYTVPDMCESADVAAERDGGVLLLYSDGTRWDYTVPDAGTHAFRVTAPQEATVTAGGVTLSDAQAVSFTPLSTHVDVPEEFAGALPGYTVYAAGGLYCVPEFSAALPDGTALAQTTDADGFPSFELPGSEMLYEECHERVESFLREIAGYGAGNTAAYYPAGYVVPDAPLLLYFRYALDSLHWTRGFTITFNELTTWGYIPLGEDAFLCQGRANFTTETRHETRENLVEYEMLWVRRNDTWCVQDMSFV